MSVPTITRLYLVFEAVTVVEQNVGEGGQLRLNAVLHAKGFSRHGVTVTSISETWRQRAPNIWQATPLKR